MVLRYLALMVVCIALVAAVGGHAGEECWTAFECMDDGADQDVSLYRVYLYSTHVATPTLTKAYSSTTSSCALPHCSPLSATATRLYSSWPANDNTNNFRVHISPTRWRLSSLSFSSSPPPPFPNLPPAFATSLHGTRLQRRSLLEEKLLECVSIFQTTAKTALVLKCMLFPCTLTPIIVMSHSDPSYCTAPVTLRFQVHPSRFQVHSSYCMVLVTVLRACSI